MSTNMIGATVIETENDEWDDNYDEAQSWDYYSDQSGEILDTWTMTFMKMKVDQ